MNDTHNNRRPMRSDMIKRGFERAPHRSLLRATGVIQSEDDFNKPFIAIANSYTDIIPGHVHLNDFGEVVREAVRAAGGVPFMFNTIGVDDGIAMGHVGMKYSLPSRELIADSVETMVAAHCFDGMICIPNCDKIVPGMLMAVDAAEHPDDLRQRRADEGRRHAGRQGRRPDLASSRASARIRPARSTDAELAELEAVRLPDLRLVLRHVHRQLDELPLRGAGHGAARQRHDPGGGPAPRRAGGAGRARRS